MPANNTALEKRLWEAADNLRAKPTALVKLIVEVIEPYHGYILDPACGSGGMFVQSAEFVRRHNANPMQQISLYGRKKETLSVRLAKMNLAVHGLNGIIREGNTYYSAVHQALGADRDVAVATASPPRSGNGPRPSSINQRR